MRPSRLYSKDDCTSGVDAIIHVASPLSHTGAPQVILEVRDADSRIVIVCLTPVKTTFLECYLRYQPYP